ncbi:hypothetical protein ES705_36915 [subsurface metagenome]|jgi:hypothetical protein
MRIIEIKKCLECPYFDNAMNDREDTFGKLRLICLKKEEGYETSINIKNDINFLHETDEEINKMLSNLDFDIPEWCPLEKKER